MIKSNCAGRVISIFNLVKFIHSFVQATINTKRYVSYIWLIKASKAVERRLTSLTLIDYYYFENSTGEISKTSRGKLNPLENITHPVKSIM